MKSPLSPIDAGKRRPTRNSRQKRSIFLRGKRRREEGFCLRVAEGNSAKGKLFAGVGKKEKRANKKKSEQKSRFLAKGRGPGSPRSMKERVSLWKFEWGTISEMKENDGRGCQSGPWGTGNPNGSLVPLDS